MNDRSNHLATPAFAVAEPFSTTQIEAALRILKHLLHNFPGTTTFRVTGEHLDQIEIVTPKFTLLLHDLSVLRKLVFARSPLPLADAYINGLIGIDGDLYAALGLKQYFASFDFSLGTRLELVRDAWRLPSKPRQLAMTPFGTGELSLIHI